jgi:cation transporter-like permease
LVTAFVASRVISVFEGTIEKLVALATLMPIVAGIGGNSGNQTITMLVRAIALGQINPANARKLLTKEIAIAVLNGLVWGSIIGLFAMLLYRGLALGLVMATAMTLNLLVAALFGVFIPSSRVQRAHYGHHRQRRLLHFSGPRNAGSAPLERRRHLGVELQAGPGSIQHRAVAVEYV